MPYPFCPALLPLPEVGGMRPIYGSSTAELCAACVHRFDVCGCSNFFVELRRVGASNRVRSILFTAQSASMRFRVLFTPPQAPRQAFWPKMTMQTNPFAWLAGEIISGYVGRPLLPQAGSHNHLLRVPNLLPPLVGSRFRAAVGQL